MSERAYKVLSGTRVVVVARPREGVSTFIDTLEGVERVGPLKYHIPAQGMDLEVCYARYIDGGVRQGFRAALIQPGLSMDVDLMVNLLRNSNARDSRVVGRAAQMYLAMRGLLLDVWELAPRPGWEA